MTEPNAEEAPNSSGETTKDAEAPAAINDGAEEDPAPAVSGYEEAADSTPYEKNDNDDKDAAVAFSDSTKEEKRVLLASSGLGSAHPVDDLPFESHFTVRIPTSTLQYRGSLLRVIDTDDDQIILRQMDEGEGKNKRVMVQRISLNSMSQHALRIGYTLVAILFCGMLFVFCFQVLILLLVAVQVYSTSRVGSLGQISGITMLSTLLAFPLMLYSMSSLMAMGSAFVIDTWRGGALFRSEKVEMANMFVFLVAPVFTLMVCLMIQYQEAWRMTAGIWCGLVCLTFCIWSLAVTIREVQACFWLVEKLHYKPPEGGEEGKWTKMMNIAKIAFIKSQINRYSGTRKERYHVAGTDAVWDDDDDRNDKGFCTSKDYVPVETKTTLYSRLIGLRCFSPFFEELDPPKRVWRSKELLETPSIVTKNNWVLQRTWCGGSDRVQQVVLANGPYALTPDQIKLSAFCTVLSSTLMTLLFIGFLVWMEQGLGAYLIVGILAVFCIIYPLAKQSYELHKMYESVSVNNQQVGYSRRSVTQPDGATLFQVWETVRINQPKEWYCVFRAVLEVGFLFIWPFVAMLVLENWPVAIMFFIMSFFSLIWRYFDSTTVLTEYGTLSKFDDKDMDHDQKYFFTTVGEDVINNKGRGIWTGIFIVFFLANLFLFLSAQASSDEVKPQDRGPRPPVLLVDDFYYPPTNDTLAYPTCRLTKGFTFKYTDAETRSDEVEGSLLGDYAFLSAMAYETSDIVKYSLDQWFEDTDSLIDEEDFVQQWREESGTTISPVYFKLFTSPYLQETAIMSIRGSETSYDWIVNMQTWSSAGLAQVVKWLTPYGWIWTPILPDLINAISFIESRAIKDVAYYTVTTRFVNDVLAGYGNKGIEKIFITGASLGESSNVIQLH